MPEAGVNIRSLWYELRGHYRSNTPGLNDMYADIKLNRGSLKQPKLLEGENRSTSEFLYLYVPTTYPDTTGGINTITFHPTTTSTAYNANLLTAELIITYTFDLNATETIANTVRRFLGEAVDPQNNTVKCTCVIYFPENPVSPKINGIYVMIRGANKAATGMTIGDGTNTITYEMNGTFCAENRTIIHDLKGAYGNATDGTMVTVTSTWNSINAGGWSGEIIYNYEFPKSSKVWQRTVYHGGISGSTIQDNAVGSNTKTYTTNVYIPGDSWKVSSAFIDGKATISSVDPPMYIIGVNNNPADYIVLGSDNENIRGERVKSAVNDITEPGAYTIRVNMIKKGTTTLQDFISSAISYVTYKMTAKAAIAVKFTYSPAFKIRAGETSPQIVAMAVNENGESDPLFDETVTLYTSSNSGSFSVTASPWSDTTIITFQAGVATYYYRDYRVGNPTITVYRQGYEVGTQVETITIAGFRFSSQPFRISALESTSVTVIATDGLGNTATTWSGTAVLSTSSNSGSFSISSTPWTDTTIITLNAGVGAFYYRDYSVGNPVISITRIDSWTFIETQLETINPVSLDFVSSPFAFTAGGTAAITVIAKDGLGNTATGWNETAVIYTSSNSGSFSILPSPWSDTTIIQFVSGVAAFYYQDTEPGNPVITVSRSDLSLYDTQQGAVTVPATQLIFVTDPFQLKAGEISSLITIIAADASGNTDTTFSGTVVLSTSSNSGYFSVLSSPWSDTTIITLTNGVAAFYYRDYCVGYPTLTVSRTGLQSDTLVVYISPFSLDIVTTPFTITVLESAPITVRATDGLGNTATNWSDTVLLGSSSPLGKFSISNTTWVDTTIITLSGGVGVFYYKDSTAGNPVLTISRIDLSISDTQSETITSPGVPALTVTKYQRNERTNPTQSDSTTSPIYAFSPDTIEYTISMKNTGTDTAASILIYDTQIFDTSFNHPLIFIAMDTYPQADSWAYTIDPALATWEPWGNIPTPGATNVRGLRWKINSAGINQTKEIRFRIRMDSYTDSNVQGHAVIKSYTDFSGANTQPPVQSNTTIATYTAPAISIKKYIRNIRTNIESDTEVNMLSGDTIEIRVDWTQSGTGGPADTFTLTDYIPSGTTYVAGSETVTYGKGTIVQSGNAVIFKVTDVKPGETGTFKFYATVD